VHFTSFCLNRRCYDQPSAQGLAGMQEASEEKFQTAPRAGLKVPAGFAGMVKASAQPAAAFDPGHQTETACGLNPQGFGGACRLAG